MRRVAAAAISAAAGLAAVLALHGGHPALAVGAPPTSSVSRRNASSPTTSPTTGPMAPSGHGGTVTAVGAAEQYGYGLLSVRVTMKGNRIVDVSLASLQTAESYSQQLAQQVVPMLRKEVLAAQSAQVSTVSGATYTSEAYLYSLQSALDRLRG